MEVTKRTIFFFDMDGTLINTDIANRLSYQAAVRVVMGIDLSSIFGSSMERFNRRQLRSLFPSFTELDYEKIIQEKERCYKYYLPKTTIIKENVAILLKYSATNRTVLVSNCRKDRSMVTLSYHGLVDKFTNIFCRNPEITTQKINKYQNAINMLGISPDNVVVFENEQSEIAGAIDAGIKVINPKIFF